MLKRLSHVIVYCSDMKRSVAFYRDQLGFAVKRESPEWSELHTGATTLALHLAQPSHRMPWRHDQMPAGEAHVGLEVLDLEKFYQEMKEKGVEFAMPPQRQDFGGKVAVLLDPDGLPISVVEEIR